MAATLSRRPHQFSENEESGFDIFRIFRIIKRNLFLYILIILITTGLMTGLAFLTYEEEYTSSGSLLINPKVVQSTDGLNESVISTSDLNLATQLANTYKYLLTSDKVMTKVIKNCDFDVSAQSLRKMVSITQEDGTSIIKIAVTSNDKKFSKKAASELMVVLPEVVNDVLDFGNISVIDSPQTPSAPNTDKTRIIFPIIGFAMGLFICFVIAFILDLASDAVKSAKDIRFKIGANLFAIIPFIKGKRKSTYGRSALIDSASSQFNFVEAYKSLRTKIETANKEDGHKKFIITSTYQNEGKSTVAVNLGIALAQKGKAVVVVDADLRKPSLGDVLGVDADDQTGIVQLLNGETDWRQTVKYMGSHNIFVVLSGGECENPSELLSSEEMYKFVEMLEKEFDYIIFDTPPAGVVTDAVVLSPLTDAAVMVVLQDYAEIDSINSVIDDFAENGTKVIGTVFNSRDFNFRRSRHYNKDYGYYR